VVGLAVILLQKKVQLLLWSSLEIYSENLKAVSILPYEAKALPELFCRCTIWTSYVMVLVKAREQCKEQMSVSMDIIDRSVMM